MNDLTARQQQVLDFIKEQMMLGKQPTIREIGDHLGITSPNGVECHLRRIESHGYIKRSKGASRGIEVVGWSPAVELRKLHDKYNKIKAAYDKLRAEVA